MELKKIFKDAKKHGLEVEFLNSYTLKIYSKKYLFDSWLVVSDEKKITLYHQNRFGADSNKCRYHIQTSVKKHNWSWITKKIIDHNNFVINHKYVNKVDKILNKYNQSFAH